MQVNINKKSIHCRFDIVQTVLFCKFKSCKKLALKFGGRPDNSVVLTTTGYRVNW